MGKRPSTAGAQLSQAFAVEAKCEEKVQGKAHRAGNRESEKRTQQKAQEIQPQFPEDLRLRQEVLTPMAGGTCLTKS